MYGKQTTDEEGNMTGKRKFTFDASLLPTYQGDLEGRTGVATVLPYLSIVVSSFIAFATAVPLV